MSGVLDYPRIGNYSGWANSGADTTSFSHYSMVVSSPGFGPDGKVAALKSASPNTKVICYVDSSAVLGQGVGPGNQWGFGAFLNAGPSPLWWLGTVDSTGPSHLNGNITSSQTTITVTNAQGILNQIHVQNCSQIFIDRESMIVTAVNTSTNVLTVTRGYLSACTVPTSPAASHSSGADVQVHASNWGSSTFGSSSLSNQNSAWMFNATANCPTETTTGVATTGHTFESYMSQVGIPTIMGGGWGWDGIFFDNTNPIVSGSVQPYIDGLGTNVSADGGTPEWDTGLQSLFTDVAAQSSMSGKILLGNGPGNYRSSYTHQTAQELEHFPFYWGATSTCWATGLAGYLANPSSLLNADTNNTNTIALATPSGTWTAVKIGMRLGLGTALLGNGYFLYDYGGGFHGSMWWFDEYDKGAGTSLAVAVTSTSSTTVTVHSGTGSRFVVGDVIFCPNDKASGSVYAFEQMHITGISGDVLTVVRGYNSTPAGVHGTDTGSFIAQKVFTLSQWNAGQGWMGQPVAAAVTIGTNMYTRTFQNGMVLVNGSLSSHTFTIPTGYTRINGTQDTTTNSGAAAGTSVTVGALDALLLIGTATVGPATGAAAPLGGGLVTAQGSAISLPSPGRITSTGTVVSAAGRGQNSNIFYAVNSGVWVCLQYRSTSATTLYARYSPDLINWFDPTNPTLTLLHSNQGLGDCLAVGYRNIGGHDVFHISMAENDSTTEYMTHVRATITGTTITWGTESALQSFASAAQSYNCAVGIGTDGVVTDWAFAQTGSGTGNFALCRSTNVDTGTAWTSGFGAPSVIFSAANNIESFAILPLTGGAMMAVGENGVVTASSTNVAYTRWGGTAWVPSTGESDVFAATATISPNDWGVARLSDTDIHVVRRNDATSTFTHRRWNGTAWVAGQTLPTHTCLGGNGLAMCSDGTSVWLFILDSAAGNPVYYIQWIAGAWGVWTVFESSAQSRINVTAYYSPDTNKIAVSWSQVNGPNYDLQAEALALSPAQVSGSAAPQGGGLVAAAGTAVTPSTTTLLYLRAGESAPFGSTPPGVWKGGWTVTGTTLGKALDAVRGSAQLTSSVVATVNNTPGGCAQFCSRPLRAQTIAAGNWTLGFGASVDLNSGRGNGYIAVMSGDGTTVRGVIFARGLIGNTVMVNSEITQYSINLSGAAVTVLAGDYLLVEIGIAPSIGHMTFSCYTDGGTSILADNASTSDAASFIKSPSTLLFAPVVVFGSAAVMGGGTIHAAGVAKPVKITGSSAVRGGGVPTALGSPSPVGTPGLAAPLGGGTIHAAGARKVLVVTNTPAIRGGGLVSALGIFRNLKISGTVAVAGGGTIHAAGVFKVTQAHGSAAVVGGGALAAKGLGRQLGTPLPLGGGTVHAAGISRLTSQVGAAAVTGGGTLAAVGTSRPAARVGSSAALGGGLLAAQGSARVIKIPGIANVVGGSFVAVSGTGFAVGGTSVLGGGRAQALGATKVLVVAGSAAVRGGSPTTAQGSAKQPRTLGTSTPLGGGTIHASGTSATVKILGFPALVGGSPIAARGVAVPAKVSGTTKALGGAPLASSGVARTVKVLGTPALVGGGLATAGGSSNLVVVHQSGTALGGGVPSAQGAPGLAVVVSGFPQPLGSGLVDAAGLGVPAPIFGELSVLGGGQCAVVGDTQMVVIYSGTTVLGSGSVDADGTTINLVFFQAQDALALNGRAQATVPLDSVAMHEVLLVRTTSSFVLLGFGPSVVAILKVVPAPTTRL